MASASNSSVPSETPVSIICSVCTDPLLKDNESIQVATVCGHVFHKKCLSDWYQSQDLYECPKCRNTTESDSSSHLYLDAEWDSEYLAVVKMMERLRKEKEEALEGLGQLRLSLDKKTEELNRLCEENADLKKQVTVAKIKEILFGHNKQLLDEQFGQLKWDDLTVSFQNELLDKIGPRCRAILNLVPLCSKTLIHLIRSDPNEIILKLVEEYYNQQLQLNGSVTWSDFTKLFNQDLHSRLNKKCGIWNELYDCPRMNLNQVPLSPKIFVALMKDEEEDTHGGDTLLATIVELFIENLSDVQIKNICKITLMKLITNKIPYKLLLKFSNVNQDEVLELVGFGILKKTTLANFDFVHDPVKFFFVEMLKKRMEEVNYLRRLDNEPYALENYFFNYFANQPSDLSIYLSKLIDFKEDDFSDLLMILAVMSGDSSVRDMQTYMDNTIDKYVGEREWLCKIKSFPISLTLIHFAAMRGDYVAVKSLLYDHNFYSELNHPRFQDLVQVCVLETSKNDVLDIAERKLILTTILEFSDVPARSHSITRLTNVHIDLLKFLILHWKFNGRDRNQILLEAARYLEPNQFDDLVQLVRRRHREMLNRRDVTGASALDLAMKRINVLPETIQIFRDAGGLL